MTILTGLDIILGVFCFSNPKACFGSCPTFYINEEDNFHYADAEGFSNAISPSMEYYDIDALNSKGVSSDSSFNLIMKNEALETHCLNKVKILACPVLENQKVYQSPKNQFFVSDSLYELQQAIAEEGNITELLKNKDRIERFSLSDENDLSSKEEIELSFKVGNIEQDLGLILNFRQTLMTTYFIYSAMGYMGDEVGDIFAKIENDTSLIPKLSNGIQKELGGVDIYVWNSVNESWVKQSSFYETGPIAMNQQILPLSHFNVNDDMLRVKLILNKGLWRLDQASVVNIVSETLPIEINPYQVFKENDMDSVGLNNLLKDDEYLISMPGNKFRFEFQLPKTNPNYDLFLYSKGYYLEWMRDSWIKEKDLLTLKQMFDEPKSYLKEQAKSYKDYEAGMEEEFWNSKIETNILSYE